MTSKEKRQDAAFGKARVVAGCRLTLMRAAAFAFALTQAWAEETKPEKVKLPDDVEKAFAAFVNTAKEARKGTAEKDLAKLCDEVASLVKLTDEQRKKLETEAGPAVAETCEVFGGKLDDWLRPFLAGYGDKAVQNLSRWKADQFASRPNVASSPQDAKAWTAAVERVLTPEQRDIYQQELGDKTVRRKKDINTYLKDALIVRRKQLEDAFKLEREGIARDQALDKERTAKLEAEAAKAVTAILAEDEAAAAKQLLGLTEDNWKQMLGGGGTYRFDNGNSGTKAVPTQRGPWLAALAAVLSPEEQKRHEGTLNRRQERREQAAMMGATAELEDKVLLSAEQRPKLEKIFLQRWKTHYANNADNENAMLYPQNLLRIGGADTDMRDLLTPEQQKRWDAFLKGANGRRPIEPKPKQDAAGESQEPPDAETIFSAHLVKLYHAERDRIGAVMQERVEELVRTTGLTGENLKLVQLAAKGSVERVLDSGWKGNVDRNIRSSVGGVGVAFLQQRLEAMGDMRYQMEPPEKQALWTETLEQVLTADQRTAYDALLTDRMAYRDRAIVLNVITQLDTTLRLSGVQGDRLEPLLTNVVKDYWPDYCRMFSGSGYVIYPHYLPVLLSGVPDKERKDILTAEQLKQFEETSQNRFGNWWESVKRNHEQRVKEEKK